jgi:hypothetical protein
MKKSRTVLIAVTSLLISPMAMAEIFKCDGPDGPIYTDRKCGPDATSVEVAETSGLSGVSDETKADLARKKAERAEARANSINTSPVNNYQFNTINTEPAGRWLRRPYRKPHNKPHDKPETLPVAVQRPATSVLRRRRR